MRNPILKQAVVVGAGMAGLAAAKAIAPHFEKVTVFDRDSLPDAPAPRSGTPQSRHTHGLLAGGHFALDRYVPRARDRSHGRRRRPDTASPRLSAWSCPVSILFLSATFGYDQFALSRPALERICRHRVEQELNIEIRPRARVTEVIASPDNSQRRGRAVRGRSRNAAGSLAADLDRRRIRPHIADSRLPRGNRMAKGRSTVEIGMDQAYSTLVFEKPEDAPTDWLVVIHAAAPPQSSRHGVHLPDGGRPLVGLSGRRPRQGASRRHRRLQGIRRFIPDADHPSRASRQPGGSGTLRGSECRAACAAATTGSTDSRAG